jgi:hypothetical protein
MRLIGIRCLMAVLTLADMASFPSQGAAATVKDRPVGLMWNRTGLPAVFPLQVKTSAGRDNVVTLYDAGTGEAALAAFIKGGALFKVLVPPGVFIVSFATGETWEGEEKLFGPGAATQVFTLPEPLTFEVRGFGVKAGHMVDITETPSQEVTEIEIKDQLICQSLRFELRRKRDDDPLNDYFGRERDKFGTYRLELRRSFYSRFCG